MRGQRKRGSEDVWNGHGGYMGIKKAKLVGQFAEQAQGVAKQAGIFRGVSIFVNGWTTPGSDELKRIMMKHGGVYHHYYNSQKTTHIIASNLPDVKIRQLKGHELIIKPEWITACLSENRLLDYKPFLLFTHQSRNQKIINFKPVVNDSKDNSSHEPTGDSSSSRFDNELTEDSYNEENSNSSNEFHNSTINNPVTQRLLNTSTSPSPVDNESSPQKGSEKDRWLAKDASDPRFLGEFFQNSRLHHISSMGSNAKEYVTSLREEHSGSFPARANLDRLRDSAGTIKKTIMHIDMDCFFVSVGLRNRPDLVGKPVAVTHSRGNKPSRGVEEDRIATEARRSELLRYQEKLNQRSGVDNPSPGSLAFKLENVDGLSSFSEIASCSYEARLKGIKNGMFLGPALKLCPELETIPYDFPGYESVSRILYDTVSSYTLDIQAVSCDEMFVNLTSLLKDLNMDAVQFVSQLRQEIKERTGCCCSVGLGENIFLARMATKKAKPDGQYLLEEDGVKELLADLKVTELPGVGRSMEQKLSSLGVHNCRDLQKLTLGQLQAEIGNKTGTQLYNFCRGIDSRKLELDQVRKTVSAEVNYGIRFTSWTDTEQFLNQLAGEVSSRLEKLGTKGRCITLKLMIRAENAPTETAKFLGHGVCDNVSRSVQLGSGTADQSRIYNQVLSMIKQMETKPQDIRGVGISVSKLDEKKTNSGNSILKFVKIKDQSGLNQNSSTNISPEKINASSSSFNPLNPEPKPQPVPEQEPKQVAQPEPEPEKQKSDETVLAEHNLDPEVFAQLPENIRKEILSEYSIAGGSTDIPSRTWRLEQVSLEDDIAGGSRDIPSRTRRLEDLSLEDNIPGPSKTLKENIEPRGPKSAAEHLSDLSFSQIDGGVLSELPSELRDEITTHFQARKKQQEKPSVETAFDTLMRISPKKPSPKKGRGRPKKGSSTDLRSKNSANLGKKHVDRDLKLHMINENSNSNSSDQFTEVNIRKPIPTPTFCGKASISEIRPLIKEWLKFTMDPMEEDTLIMTEFLDDLISNKKIDVVSIILKCVYRNILKLENSEPWKRSYGRLLEKVQTKMHIVYGKPLYIQDQFSLSNF